MCKQALRFGFWGRLLVFSAAAIAAVPFDVLAQPYAPPDRGAPGDEMIQQYLRKESEKLEASFLGTVTTAEEWAKLRPKYKEEYLYMLGLWPLPEKTPLEAKVTGKLEGKGFRVELLHYQSKPYLYVTANLYLPAEIKAEERLPAVLYVCGHSGRGRDGNKVAYQSHGIWFARHGYVCLVVDTLQLGEIAAIHHGTYKEQRWWWHSRGYTPAGVECWNGVRGIDYLISRPEVDPDRIAVTGISGGGAATFWVAAADERVKVAVPVSGMADLLSYVPNRVINGHCDCMFLHNAFAWPWTRIAGLIAPRPLLFVNSDQDQIFPMDANERVLNRLKRLYSLFGASDLVNSVVSVGGHAYRQDIRQAAYRFINTQLKNDPRPVLDSEIDLVSESSKPQPPPPLDPVKLRVFPKDADIPSDQMNTRIDETFVPMANVRTPREGDFESWKRGLLEELRRVTFHSFPERVPPARVVAASSGTGVLLETEPGIELRLSQVSGPAAGETPKRVWLLVSTNENVPDWVKSTVHSDDVLLLLQPRGFGETCWTRKNPPNYVERSHLLLGRTVDSGRVWDIIAATRYLRQKFEGKTSVMAAGEGGAAVLASYAALLEPEIEGLLLRGPAMSHADASAPQFLNVLRVCDVPEILGMLAPRRLIIQGETAPELKKVKAVYGAARAPEKLILP